MVTKTIPDKHTAQTYLRRPTTNNTTYIRGRSSSTANDYKKFNFSYMQSNKISNGFNKPKNMIHSSRVNISGQDFKVEIYKDD